MSVKPSDIIEASDQPTNALTLWAMPSLHKANWRSGVSVKTSFTTAISSPLTASEQRWGLTGTPRRTVTAELYGNNTGIVSTLRSMARRMAKARFLFPIYSDQAVTTGSSTIGTNIIPVDTTLKRLPFCGRVVIARQTPSLAFDVFDVQLISSTTDSQITLSNNLTHSYPTGSFVYPLIEAQIVATSDTRVITDKVTAFSVQAAESTGSSQLAATSALGVTPTGIGQYKGYPILPGFDDYAIGLSNGNSIVGGFSTSGIGSYPTIYGARSPETFSISINTLNRYDAWRAIRLFDSRAGSLHPFFVISPATEHELVSISGTEMKVTSFGFVNDWQFRPYIGFVGKNGTRYVRAVAFVSRAGGLDTLALESSVPDLTLGTIARCTTAWLVRLSSDEMEEKWITTEAMQTQWQVVELLDQKSVTINNLNILTSTSLTVEDGDSCGLSASGGIRYYQAQNCDGLLQNVWIKNTGFDLPFFFTSAIDNTCYKVPVGSTPSGTPGAIHTIKAIGPCCNALVGEFRQARDYYTKELVNIFVPVAVVAAGPACCLYFALCSGPCVCYYIDLDDPIVTNPSGTVVPAPDWKTEAALQTICGGTSGGTKIAGLFFAKYNCCTGVWSDLNLSEVVCAAAGAAVVGWPRGLPSGWSFYVAADDWTPECPTYIYVTTVLSSASCVTDGSAEQTRHLDNSLFLMADYPDYPAAPPVPLCAACSVTDGEPLPTTDDYVNFSLSYTLRTETKSFSGSVSGKAIYYSGSLYAVQVRCPDYSDSEDDGSAMFYEKKLPGTEDGFSFSQISVSTRTTVGDLASSFQYSFLAYRNGWALQSNGCSVSGMKVGSYKPSHDHGMTDLGRGGGDLDITSFEVTGAGNGVYVPPDCGGGDI